MLIHCPSCNTEYDCAPGKYECECGAKFYVVANGRIFLDDSTPDATQNKQNVTPDIDKTIPPRRENVEQESIDATLPGERNRKSDGHFEAGDLILGRYKVLSELGQGGMGVVYKCFDEIAGIEIALKALPPELSHNTMEMEDVKDNFQLVSKLVHQNIAISKNLEKDNSTGNYYLIMECVEGEDLRQWIRRKRREKDLTIDSIRPVISQIAAALDYAHEERIIHRDIKPGNIMINLSGHVKVLDFGLAAQIHSSMTRVSMANQGTSGTASYMAPEQWRGRTQGAAADQYALAVMVYEMLAGHLPFDGTEVSVLREAVLNDTAEPIEGISSTAQQALAKGMAKNPADRFGTCSDFVAALCESSNLVQEAEPLSSVSPSSVKDSNRKIGMLSNNPGQQGEIEHKQKKKLFIIVFLLLAVFCLVFVAIHQTRKAAAAQKELAWKNEETARIAENEKRAEEARRAALEAEEAEKAAREKAKQIAEAEQKEAERKAEAERKEAERKAEAERKEAEWKAEAERKRIRDTWTAEDVMKDFASSGVIWLPGGVELKMVKVEAGTFTMGAEDGENRADEKPHTVTLRNDFYIGQTEVTKKQWCSLLDGNCPPQEEDLPIDMLFWSEAQAFCNRLTEMAVDKLPAGYRFDLPTEAQWEFAARGGNKNHGYKYSGSNDLGYVGWFAHNSGGGSKPHPVGTKHANELGLFDMSGNINEWCRDWYEIGYAQDPEFLRKNSGSTHVLHGGGWGDSDACRVSWRAYMAPNAKSNTLGFRLALVPTVKLAPVDEPQKKEESAPKKAGTGSSKVSENGTTTANTETGTIVLSANPPGLNVYLDGKFIGRTEPEEKSHSTSKRIMLKNLSVGAHTITISNRKARPSVQNITVNIGKGQTVQPSIRSFWLPDTTIVLKNGSKYIGRLTDEYTEESKTIRFRHSASIISEYKRNDIREIIPLDIIDSE